MPTKDPKAKAKGINRIFIGVLLTNAIITPLIGSSVYLYIIGYLYIILGLNMLVEYSPLFRSARLFAVLSFIFCFSNFYQIKINIEEIPKWFYVYTFISGLVAFIFHIVLHYYIIFGILQIPKSDGSRDLSSWAKKLFIALITTYFIQFTVSNIVYLTIGILRIAPILRMGLIACSALLLGISQISYLVYLKKNAL
jgi:hypothetical protein